MSRHRRLRCADLGEHTDCLALIDGADREIVLDHPLFQSPDVSKHRRLQIHVLNNETSVQ